MPIRVLIADDHEVVRFGLANLFGNTDVEVIAQARSGKEAQELTREHRPQVVLLDIRMPNGDGLETLEAIRAEFPEIAVLILSTFDNPTYVARAVALGAKGYLLKGATQAELLDSIRAAAEGRSLPHIDQSRRIAGTMSRSQDIVDDEVTLTQRESQVLRHLALGLSNKDIGRSLEISVETVKEHVQNVLRKIQVSDRTQAAVWAVRKGLV